MASFGLEKYQILEIEVIFRINEKVLYWDKLIKLKVKQMKESLKNYIMASSTMLFVYFNGKSITGN